MSPTATSSASRSSAVASSSASAPTKSKRGSASGPSNSNDHIANSLVRRANGRATGGDHDPFRIEVQNVTPVSISLLWSVRPPPISQYSGSARNRNAASRRDAEASTDDRDSLSDGEATAVEEEPSEGHEAPENAEAVSAKAKTLLPPTASASAPSPPLSRILDAGVSVAVNGHAWPHVLLCDQGADEAIIIVYGLLPAKEYEVDLTVGSGSHASVSEDEDGHAVRASLTTTVTTSQNHDSASGSDSAGFATPERRDSAIALGARAPNSAGSALPSRTTSESGHIQGTDHSDTSPSIHHRQQAELSAAEARRDALAATLRQNRKDASRAESGIRNEIEGIKRALERMSLPDHRSKQKVLALQESIRQANQQASEQVQEAESIEAEQSDWDTKASLAREEEDARRKEVEIKEAEGAEKAEADSQLTAEQEKARNAYVKQLAAKWSELEKLKAGRLAELEAEITKLQTETERIRNSSTPPPAPPGQQNPALHPSASANWHRTGGLEPNAPPFHPANAGGYRSVSGPAASTRGQARDRGGRGGGKSVGGNAPNHRNNASQLHRRGRGAAGSGSSATSHGQYATHQQPPLPPSSVSPYMPASQATGFSEPYTMNPSPNMSTAPGQFAPPGPSHYSSLPGLNTSMTDFLSPGSASASPVITRGRNLSPMPPSSGNAEPSPDPAAASAAPVSVTAPWAHAGSLAQDFSPQFPHHDVGSAQHSRYAFTRGMPAVSSASESPTLHHHQSSNSLFAFGNGGRRDSPTSAFFGAHGPSLVPPPQQSFRRGSYGTPGFRDDDAFDPTAGPLPSQHFGGGGASGSSGRVGFNASPWSSARGLAGAEGSGDAHSPLTHGVGLSATIPPPLPPNGSASPWAQSSPLLDVGVGGISGQEADVGASAGANNLAGGIWSPTSSSRPLRGGTHLPHIPHQHPYQHGPPQHRHSPSLQGSASAFASGGGGAGQFGPMPLRHNSGSSTSTGGHSSPFASTSSGHAHAQVQAQAGGGGGGGSLPSSPLSQAPPPPPSLGTGAFGAIGGEKVAEQRRSGQESLEAGPTAAATTSTSTAETGAASPPVQE